MTNFIKIVKNYEHIVCLGKKIIAHKDLIRKSAPQKLDEEFKLQELRIQKFCDTTKKAEKEWKKSPYSINTYWTGWS